MIYYTKEQLEEMMKAANHIQTVLSYSIQPNSKTAAKMKYIKDMIQMGLDNA